MPERARVVLYTKSSCGLCEKMKAEMKQAPCDELYTLEEVNIESCTLNLMLCTLMKPKLYSPVKITRDDPTQQIHAGDEGALLDWLDAVGDAEKGAVIELYDRPHDPVVTVPASWIEAIATSRAADKDHRRTKRAG